MIKTRATAYSTSMKREPGVPLDYAKDPCKGCGRYPLAVTNKSGICRNCQRRPKLIKMNR